MAAGPKAAVDASVLPWRPRAAGSARFGSFCQKFIRVPKGTGALSPLVLREWQLSLIGSVLDADPAPRVAGWCLPRGQGKSTLVAALGLYELMTGGEGATVIVAAVDERQAGIVFGIARRMVELSPDLESRIQVFKDKLVVPSRGASFQCLPSTPASLEGLDYSLAICDEIGRQDPETWQVIALASGKRERSTLIGIGTPGPREDNVLAQLRAYAEDHPEDRSQVYVEFGAAGFADVLAREQKAQRGAWLRDHAQELVVEPEDVAEAPRRRAAEPSSETVQDLRVRLERQPRGSRG